MKKVLIPSFVFILLLGAFTAIKVAAQTQIQGLDITVSPPVFDLTANPGSKVNERFRLRNNATKAIELQVQVTRLISDPNNGSPVPESSAKGEELSWVTIDPQTFSAPPREWKDINFTIDIPENAAFGYYYVLRITPKGGETQKQTGATVKAELLVVVLLNVKKDGAISRAKLIDFKPTTSISEYLPVTFDTTLLNEGNVHIKPRGNIFITQAGKKDLAILDVNEVNGSILPGGKRTFKSSWSDGFLVNEEVTENGQVKLDKNGKPVTKLSINWNKLTSTRIGPYTATLLLVYDDGKRDQTIEGQTTFWVIPYVAIGVVIISLILIFLILRFLLRRYIAAQIRKAQK